LLVFSVAPFKIDQNKNQNRSIDKVQKLKKERSLKGNYAKTLAKIQVTSIFLMQDMRRSFFPKFIWRRHVGAHLNGHQHVGAHPDGHQHGGRKPTETSVTELCYKSLNVSPEELKNTKIILFPKQELFRKPNSPK